MDRAVKTTAADSRTNGNGNGKLPVPLLADQRLISRCLAGDWTAWEELFATCEGPVHSAIRSVLVVHNRDPNLVEEISARCWYSLILNDHRLLRRFDPHRGCRLSTFLAIIAKGQAIQHLRAETRRKRREGIAARTAINSHQQSEHQTNALLTEFLGRLSPREREFCDAILLGTNGKHDFSKCNVWKLRSRIREKLRRFIRNAALD